MRQCQTVYEGIPAKFLPQLKRFYELNGKLNSIKIFYEVPANFLKMSRIETALPLASWLQDHSQVKN